MLLLARDLVRGDFGFGQRERKKHRDGDSTAAYSGTRYDLLVKLARYNSLGDVHVLLTTIGHTVRL